MACTGGHRGVFPLFTLKESWTGDCGALYLVRVHFARPVKGPSVRRSVGSISASANRMRHTP